MHCLRRTYGRALQGAVSMQKTCAAHERAYSTELRPSAALRTSKEERAQLVMQFVTKYKASYDGKLPGITLLRKEVGGKYEILKEILDGMKADKEKSEMEISAGGSAEPQVLDHSRKRKTLPKKDRRKEKTLLLGMVRSTETKREYTIADSSMATNAMQEREQAMSSSKEDLQPLMETSGGINEDCNDSNVAAPEYQCMSLPQNENLSKLAGKRMEPIPDFYLIVTKIPARTTCADLREAFKDCGEILNASVSHARNCRMTTDGKLYFYCAVHFKTEEGLKAAMMKDEVLLQGQLVDLKLDWDGHSATKLMTCEVKQAKSKYCDSKPEAQKNGLQNMNDVKNVPARHIQTDKDFDFEGKASL